MNTIEERAAYKRSMPRKALSEKHVQNCKVIPDRSRLLKLLQPNCVVAEIGVAFGDFSGEIWEITKPKKLHLIDAWDTDRYKEGLDGIRKKFSYQIESEIISVNIGHSTDVLSSMEDGYFDWVYIDTSHSYNNTRQELALAQQKCRAGGRICGHDFTSGNVITPVPYGVIEACHEFCVNYDWEYEYLTLEHHGHFSFCLKKIT